MLLSKGLEGAEIADFGWHPWSPLSLGSQRTGFLSSLEPEVEGIATDMEGFTDMGFSFTPFDRGDGFLA